LCNAKGLALCKFGGVISAECYTFKPLNSHVLYLSLCYYLMFSLCLVLSYLLGLKWKHMQILIIKPKETTKELRSVPGIDRRLPGIDRSRDRSYQSGIDRSLGSIVESRDRSPSELPEREQLFDS
jgi:hypothetical protein